MLSVIAFSSVLWGISKPLVFFLVLYALIGTLVTTIVFGKPLVRLNFEQLKREANLRFSLVRIRENAEAIAFRVLGTLRDQLLYPNTDIEVEEQHLQQVLEQVNLAGLDERFGGFDAEQDWADVLSLGEQQRLTFARLLLNQPQYAILDEATSALDLGNEERLYHHSIKPDLVSIFTANC